MTKKVNIGLKDNVHAQAKIISTLKKIPLGKFLEKAIEEYVHKEKHVLEELLKDENK
jgi:hypothetical protein